MACLSAAVLSHASTSTFEIKITGDDKSNGDALPSALVKGAEEAFSVNKKGIDELEKGELDSAMAYFSKASSMLPLRGCGKTTWGLFISARAMSRRRN